MRKSIISSENHNRHFILYIRIPLITVLMDNSFLPETQTSYTVRFNSLFHLKVPHFNCIGAKFTWRTNFWECTSNTEDASHPTFIPFQLFCYNQSSWWFCLFKYWSSIYLIVYKVLHGCAILMYPWILLLFQTVLWLKFICKWYQKS